jgi:hypothetical protein
MSGKPKDDDRVSIPLDPETALRAILAVKPDDPPQNDDGAKQPTKKDDAPAE